MRIKSGMFSYIFNNTIYITWAFGCKQKKMTQIVWSKKNLLEGYQNTGGPGL